MQLSPVLLGELYIELSHSNPPAIIFRTTGNMRRRDFLDLEATVCRGDGGEEEESEAPDDERASSDAAESSSSEEEEQEEIQEPRKKG
jgi:hypothetical protein